MCWRRPAAANVPGRLRRAVRWLARSIDLVVAGVFALAYLARFVRPNALTWPLQLLGVGLPFVTLVLLLVVVVRLSGMRPRSRLLHGVLVGLVVMRFAPHDLIRPTRAQDGDLTLVTYNLPRWAGPEASAKQRALYTYAGAARPDVWAFQEPFVAYTAQGIPGEASGVVVSPFLTALRDSFGYRVGRTAFARTARSAQPVFTGPSVRVMRAEERQFVAVPGVTPTSYTRLEVRHAERALVIYNVHLYTTGRRKPWREGVSPLDVRAWGPFLRQYRDNHLRRAAEADTLRRALDRETVPVVVLGDLNATPHEWVFGRLARGLQDGGKEGGGLRWGATWHRRFPIARIDHALVSPALRVVDAANPPLGISDHKPLAVRLRWR